MEQLPLLDSKERKNKVSYNVENNNRGKDVLDLDAVGWWSFATEGWLTKYIWNAYKNGFTVYDVPYAAKKECIEYNSNRLERMWEKELVAKGKEKASLGKVLWLFCRWDLIVSALVYTAATIFAAMSPTIFLKKLLQYCESADESWLSGLQWVAAYTASEIIKAILNLISWSYGVRTAVRVRAAFLGLAHRKILRLNSLGDKSSGQIINMFANDGARLVAMLTTAPMLVAGPLATIWGIFFVYWTLGPWALFGMLVFSLLYPIHYGISLLCGYFRLRAIRIGDERYKLMGELLNYIKLIKMYAWEDAFARRVRDLRNREIKEIRRLSYCNSIGLSLNMFAPLVSAVLALVFHVLAGGNLLASQAFPVITFCTKQLKNAMKSLREGANALQEGLVVIPRYKDLFLLEEPNIFYSVPVSKDLVLEIVDGNFAAPSPSCDESCHTVKLLSDISLKVPKGHLIGVCGAVGSGKSSLLRACLGQLPIISGRLYRGESIAYVSQEAWIQNVSFKENILFGESYNAERYFSTVHACALFDDISSLPYGDETEVGERGANLSGGQKQRLALARALYANRELYLLDDPLSAVDAHVGAHIMEHGILGLLRRRSVILVTHQVAHLTQCDTVLVLKNGKIVSQGPHTELMQVSPDYQAIVEAADFRETETPPEEISPSSSFSYEREIFENGRKAERTKPEKQVSGYIKGYAYSAYLKSAGGYCLCFLTLMAVCLNIGSSAFSNFWLALWLNAGNGHGNLFQESSLKVTAGNTTIAFNVPNKNLPEFLPAFKAPFHNLSSPENLTILQAAIDQYRDIRENPEFPIYFYVYVGSIGIIFMTCIIRFLSFVYTTVRAGRKLHDSLFNVVINSPVRFFETTPVGRLLNLFSKDLDEVESRLPSVLEDMLAEAWRFIFAIVVVVGVFPIFFVALVILILIFYFSSKVFRTGVRDLQRVESIARAPIISNLSATLEGLPVIHAFRKEDQTRKIFRRVFDLHGTSFLLSNIALRWVTGRIDMASTTMTAIVGFLVVAMKGTVAPALAGLAMSDASRILAALQHNLRLLTEAEQRFISVERMQYWIRSLTPEGNASPIYPPPRWPSRGCIEFKNVSLSYGPDLPPVFEEFSLVVKPSEKLGVVGRTGAGKSSLIAALFRTIELSGGAIFIDNVNIAYLDLKTLRRAITVIPQDPVLFNGSIRNNLDPFEEHSDEDLIAVLKQTRLLEKVQQLGGLSVAVGECGNSLAVGERQLLCLARALLRGSKILLLDEATASVDPETEQAINQTICEEFSECTVITIAHRLPTVMTSDRVLLMDHGALVELDKPKNLLRNKNSRFAQLAATVGYTSNDC